MYTNAPEKFIKKFCDDVGLRVLNLHSLRHLNASFLIHGGCDVKAVQVAMGHSTPMTTLNIYTQEFEEARVKVSEAMGNALQVKFG